MKDKMKKENIRISEIFHSVQGEGNTMGKPAVFLRLTGCNLLCGNAKGSLKGKSQEEINDMQAANAEWTCDSIAVWLTGKKWNVNDLVEHLKEKYAEYFLSGSMLVITGGEPLSQQKILPFLISGLRSSLSKSVRIEIETNGTIRPIDQLTKSWYDSKVDQFNVSPKLSNSGMPAERRIIPEALNELVLRAYHDKAIFKFVVTKHADMDEIEEDYIKENGVPEDKIWLMPGCSNREQFEIVAPYVANLCKQRGFQFSSRLQINLWNQVTGV